MSLFALTKWFGRFRKKFYRRQQDDKLATLSVRVHGARETAPSVPQFSIENSQPADSAWPAPQPVSTLPPASVTVPSNHKAPISLPELEFTPVPEILRHFSHRIHANLVLFADRNGVPKTSCKNSVAELPQLDLEMIAKLAAGQMAASREIGRCMSNAQNFTSLFQEGERRNLFIYEINPDFILIAVVEKTVVLGMVRIHAHEAVMSLRKTLELI